MNIKFYAFSNKPKIAPIAVHAAKRGMCFRITDINFKLKLLLSMIMEILHINISLAIATDLIPFPMLNLQLFMLINMLARGVALKKIHLNG